MGGGGVGTLPEIGRMLPRLENLAERGHGKAMTLFVFFASIFLQRLQLNMHGDGKRSRRGQSKGEAG